MGKLCQAIYRYTLQINIIKDMKRNALMEECRKFITPEIKLNVDLSIFVANRIFDILENQHMTQRDLAALLGKSEAEISKWLKGTHNFTFQTIAKIEIALGESIIEISGKPQKTEYVYCHFPFDQSFVFHPEKCNSNEIPLSGFGWLSARLGENSELDYSHSN